MKSFVFPWKKHSSQKSLPIRGQAAPFKSPHS
ncbi:hypothetical protein CBNA_0307 [Coxiella burnetii str. Namibia]|nr:hypothetical protein CBNA_0307 [Coxiella burnetii str. Namibia]